MTQQLRLIPIRGVLQRHVRTARELARELGKTVTLEVVDHDTIVDSSVADRLAAFIMAGYCAATAVLFKQFWQPGDFWHRGQLAAISKSAAVRRAPGRANPSSSQDRYMAAAFGE